MKQYGRKRKDTLEGSSNSCPCCATQYHKRRLCKVTAKRRRRKTARQGGRKDTYIFFEYRPDKLKKFE